MPGLREPRLSAGIAPESSFAIAVTNQLLTGIARQMEQLALGTDSAIVAD